MNTGAEHFRIGLRIALTSWIFQAVLVLFQFCRPSPYGGPYVQHLDAYVFHALFYELLGTFLLSAPFLLLWLAFYGRGFASRRWMSLHLSQAALLGAHLFFDHLDHELMRFMGLHFTPTFIQTYLQSRAAESVFFQSLLLDKGGPGLPIVLWIAVPGLYARWVLRRALRKPVQPWPRSVALAIGLPPLLIPWLVYSWSGTNFRMSKVQPLILTLWEDRKTQWDQLTPPPDLEALKRQAQQQWLAEEPTDGWSFPSQEYPYWREPATRSSIQEPWNIIYFQLETFRAWNVDLMRPDSPPPTTPYLDSLAQSPAGAYWTRFMSFGRPTVDGFISGHCSATPHSRAPITTAFSYVNLDCLPQALRRQGYRAEAFTGSDPDWDGQTLWLQRWYDKSWFWRDTRDREIFLKAGARIQELGASGQPFMATLVSISNHYPFRSREPELDIAGQDTPGERIRNTMHYTDDAIREMLESFRGQPWFDRTLVVVTGDHGYNLGEHDHMAGQYNFYREAVWVPLIVYGAHPKLPKGRHDELGSLIDIAPTLADLLGLREPTPWQGHSLLQPMRQPRALYFARDELSFAEAGPWSALLDGALGRARLYSWPTDPLQNQELSETEPGRAAGMLKISEQRRALNDWLLRSNHVLPPPKTSSASETSDASASAPASR